MRFLVVALIVSSIFTGCAPSPSGSTSAEPRSVCSTEDDVKELESKIEHMLASIPLAANDEVQLELTIASIKGLEEEKAACLQTLGKE